MKITNKIIGLVFLSFLVFSSCKKEKEEISATGDEQVAAEQNATENRTIPIAEIEEGITVQGAITVPGSAPAPNSDLDFQMDETAPVALQNTGFTIEFSSTQEIAGAYLVLKDADGNKTTSYLDIPNYAFGSPYYEKSASFKEKKNGILQLKSGKTEVDYVIDVDFSSVLQPGSFCYGICVYDSENNVSQARNVCVEVEAWGGNASLIGKWELYKSDYSDDDGDYIQTIYCESGQNFDAAEEKNYSEELVLQISENGSFSLKIDESGDWLDWEKSSTECSAIYEPYTYSATIIGNWAFSESNNFLGLVAFEETYVEDGETGTYTYEDGEGLIGLYVEIVGNEIILSEQYTYDGITYTNRYYFRRI